MVSRGSPQLIFVLEVVGNQRVVYTSAFRDVAGRRSFEAVFGERFDSSIEELLLSDDTALLQFSDRLDRLDRF